MKGKEIRLTTGWGKAEWRRLHLVGPLKDYKISTGRDRKPSIPSRSNGMNRSLKAGNWYIFGEKRVINHYCQIFFFFEYPEGNISPAIQ